MEKRNEVVVFGGDVMREAGRILADAFGAELSEGGEKIAPCVWIHKDGNIIGRVNQSPDDPRVMNRGEWSGKLEAVDGGLVSTGFFSTPEEAATATTGLIGKTFDEVVNKPTPQGADAQR